MTTETVAAQAVAEILTAVRGRAAEGAVPAV